MAVGLSSSGCAAERARVAASPEATLCVPGDSVRSVSQRFEWETRMLSERIAAVDGREGYYARRALRDAADDRDDLLEVLLARDQTLERCAPLGPERDAAMWSSTLLLAAVARGADPIDRARRVAVVDYRHPPQAMPFADRACSGHGLEGAATCLVFGPLAAIADIATLPAGTWFWAGETRTESVALDRYPPRSDLARDVGEVVLRRTGEGVDRAIRMGVDDAGADLHPASSRGELSATANASQ